MSIACRFAISVALLGLCGCPFGSPRDHNRPDGHIDTTIATSPVQPAILFNTVGSGGRDLFVLDLSTLKVTPIAETPEYETSASFSSDGKTIVYSAGIQGDRADHIFTIQSDGSQKTQLTKADANDTSARFSPDGKTIVFARDKNYDWGGLASNWSLGGVICLIDADGSNFRQLTPDKDYAFDPHFNTDGTQIVYSTSDGRMSIPVDGSTAPQSLPGPAEAVTSPDGKLIAYPKGQYSPDLKIYSANVDGSSERELTPNMGGCYRPVFNAAGTQLYFLREEWPSGPTGTPKFSLWEITLPGAQVGRIADSGLFDAPLRWKP